MTNKIYASGILHPNSYTNTAHETRPGYLNEEIISARESPNALFRNSTI